jgi:hypothetical protein
MEIVATFDCIPVMAMDKAVPFEEGFGNTCTDPPARLDEMPVTDWLENTSSNRSSFPELFVFENECSIGLIPE